jgi:hypothetical protein
MADPLPRQRTFVPSGRPPKNGGASAPRRSGQCSTPEETARAGVRARLGQFGQRHRHPSHASGPGIGSACSVRTDLSRSIRNSVEFTRSNISELLPSRTREWPCRSVASKESVLSRRSPSLQPGNSREAMWILQSRRRPRSRRIGVSIRWSRRTAGSRFQSAPPRGATPNLAGQGAPRDRGFNPRPRLGATPDLAGQGAPRDRDFNPRHRVRARIPTTTVMAQIVGLRKKQFPDHSARSTSYIRCRKATYVR